MTPAVIEANRNALKQLPLEELNEICIHEGLKGIDIRKQTQKLVDRIINRRVENYSPINEERYQFVLWLYRIRTQYPQMPSMVNTHSKKN